MNPSWCAVLCVYLLSMSPRVCFYLSFFYSLLIKKNILIRKHNTGKWICDAKCDFCVYENEKKKDDKE